MGLAFSASKQSATILLAGLMACGNGADPDGDRPIADTARPSGGRTAAGGSSGDTPAPGGGHTSDQSGGSFGRTGGGGGGSSVVSAGGGVSSGGASSGGASGGGASGGRFPTGGSSGSSGGGGAEDVDLGPVGRDGFALDVRLASEIERSAPSTVGIVRWDLNELDFIEAHIEFGPDTGYGMTAPVDLTSPYHRTLLLGMKPESTYHFQIVASDGTNTVSSDDYVLTTGAPPPELVVDVTVGPSDRVEPGFVIASSWDILDGGLGGWTYILDTDGDLVWWYRPDEKEHFIGNGYGRARMSADSQDMWLAVVDNGGGPLLRVSMDTLEVQSYPDVVASHDICATSGETMAFIDYSEGDCGGVVEIEKSGDTRRLFDPFTGVGLESCHGNAIRYSASEDMYLYSVLDDDVFIVDRDGSLQGRLSEWVEDGTNSWGGQQHGVQLLDDRFLIFANFYPGDSAVVEYDLQGNLLRTIPAAYQTNFYGDVQRLPSGNTVVSAGHLLQVIASDDSVVFEATVTDVDSSLSFLGYVEFRDSLYGPPLDIND